MDDATADSLSRGRALVLLIDGLDEDAALASVTGQRSIASLLSGNLPGGLHIIAATRPYPKVLREIGTGSHPSGAFRDLPPSPYAVVSREQAAAEIDSAVLKEGLDTDVAGFLTAARSGLTLRDFTALTGRPPGIILSMLRTSFRRSIRPEPGADRDRKAKAPYSSSRMARFGGWSRTTIISVPKSSASTLTASIPGPNAAAPPAGTRRPRTTSSPDTLLSLWRQRICHDSWITPSTLTGRNGFGSAWGTTSLPCLNSNRPSASTARPVCPTWVRPRASPSPGTRFGIVVLPFRRRR